jgi:hypothetical protein
MPEATAATKTRTKPGFVSRYVHIPQASWDKLTAHIDKNCLHEGKFISQLVAKAVDELK